MCFLAIPSYSRYEINDKTIVRRIDNGNILKGSVNPKGYINHRLYNDDLGKIITVGLHRLMCLAFNGSNSDKDAIVNHRDGIKANNSFGNLEWCTYKENIEHAGLMGLTSKCKPIDVLCLLSGVVTPYPSVTECARTLGLTKDAVLHRLKSNGTRVFPENKAYRHRIDSEEWSIILSHKFGRSRGIMVRDLNTGIITSYDKISDFSKVCGLSISGIYTLAMHGDHPVIKGLLQIKLADDTRPWRHVENAFVELMKTSGKRPVVIFNSLGMQQLYESAKQCATMMGINPTALHYRLNNVNKNPWKDGFSYYYYDEFIKTVPICSDAYLVNP